MSTDPTGGQPADSHGAWGGHDALFYDTDGDLVQAGAAFLRAGLDAGDAAVLVCGERKNAMLVEALDRDGRITVLHQDEVYHRPPGAIAAYTRFLEQRRAEGRPRVRVLGELSLGERPAGWAEWLRYEAVLNHAFAGAGVWVRCGYDARTVPAEVLIGAEATHPYLMTATSQCASARYVDPAEYLSSTCGAGPDPLESGPPAFDADEVTEMALLRRDLRAALTGTGRWAGGTEVLVAAVNEVASNALLYGAAPIRVRVWSTADRYLCTVTDHGGGFDDPFAGYLCPADRATGGRGLWLARQLCDAVSMSRNGDEFTVRLHLYH